MDTMRFIRQNFADIIKALIFVGGPFVLAFTMLYMLYQNEIGEIHLYLRGEHKWLDYRMDFAFYWMVIGSGMYYGRVFLASVSAIYMKLYEEKGKGNFTNGDISKMLMSNIWKILGTATIVLVLLWLTLGGLMVLVYVLSQITPVLGILFFMLICVGAFIFYFPYSYLNASIYMIIVQYGFSGFKAIGLGFRIMRGNFWTAWLVLFVSSLALIGVWYLLQIPTYYAGFLQELFAGDGMLEYERYGLMMMLITLCVYFMFTMVDGFYYFLCHFLFYSNREGSSGVGLKQRIMEIGNQKSYHDFEPSY